MNPTTQNLLKTIGNQLDKNIYPVVHDGGFVTPCETNVPLNQGEENRYENERPRRSETGSWQRAAAWQGSANKTTPLVCPDVVMWYESELDALVKTYPKTQVWKQPEGLILLIESAVLQGLSTPAIFVVAIPTDLNLRVKGWGFWGISAVGVEWIGPRHTNFPDGSICAFEPSDNTWRLGDSLTELIDLYTLWALRHLYLKTFGLWPGYQSIHWVYERIMEVKSEEFCGCADSTKRYGECCEIKDKSSDIIAAAYAFLRCCHNGERNTPTSTLQIALFRSNPPKITDWYSKEKICFYRSAA